MDHGVKHEPDAVATMVGKSMPFFHQNLNYVEEGCYLLSGSTTQALIELSPDGSLKRLSGKSDKETIIDAEYVTVIERKCPLPKKENEIQFYEVSKYYIRRWVRKFCHRCYNFIYRKERFLYYTLIKRSTFLLHDDAKTMQERNKYFAIYALKDTWGKTNGTFS